MNEAKPIRDDPLRTSNPKPNGSGRMIPPPPLSPPRQRAWPAILVAAITIAVFSPVLRNGFVDSWDDDLAITANPDFNPPRLANLAHYWVPPPHEQFYVPVTYTLWGIMAMVARTPADHGGAPARFNPAFFHAASLLSHALAAAVVFLILREILRPNGEKNGDAASICGRIRSSSTADLPALAGALLFALHPLQVEGVAWASSMYTPLSALFGLFAIWQHMQFCDAIDVGRRSRAWRHLAIATLAFLLGMLTKPSVVTVPLIAAAIQFGFRRRRSMRYYTPLIAWAIVSMPIVLATRLALHAGTVQTPEPWQRVLVALDATAFYLYKLLWPAQLCPDYGRSPLWLLNHPLAWLTCLAPLGAFVILRVARRRCLWLNAAAGIFVLGLMPTLGLTPFDFQLYSTPADRYAYLAMLAPAIVVAVLLARFHSRALLAGCCGILTLLAIVGVNQLRHWRDPWHLFAHTFEVNPQSRASINAFSYLLIPKPGVPVQPFSLTPTEIAHMGDMLMEQKRSALAIPAYQLALSRGGANLKGYERLAVALYQTERYAEAADVCRKALALNRQDAEAHAQLGAALGAQGQLQGAEAEFVEALKFDPANPTARTGLSRLQSATEPATARRRRRPR